jgi:hypothetical protein
VPCLWRRLSSSPSGHPNETPEFSLLAWSCALIFWPRILLFAIGQSQQSLTPLESFLSLHFGLLFAFSAVGLVVNVKRFHSGYLSPPPLSNHNNRVISFSFLHTDPFRCSRTCARREGTSGSSSSRRAHGIFRTPERLLLVQYDRRWEPPQIVFSVYWSSGDLGLVGGKWLLRMVQPITATVPDPVRRPNL